MLEHVFSAVTIGTLKAEVRENPSPSVPPATPADFQMSKLLVGRLTFRPSRMHNYESVEPVLRYIVSRLFPLYLMATHRFGVANLDMAVRSAGGQGAPGALHLTVLVCN